MPLVSEMKNTVKQLARRALPPAIYRWLARRRYRLRPSPLDPWRRLQPVSPDGQARGECIDRWYIAEFLRLHSSDIHGRVLEVADNSYTTKFGQGVERSEVLHVVAGNPVATIVGDLATGENIPIRAFDCMILTQVLPFIYDVRGAIAHAYEALKPGGVLLATLPGTAHISRYDMDHWGDFWRFTNLSAERLFHEVFRDVEVATYGNVLTAAGYLHYLASNDVTREELDYHDPDYQVIITVRARRALDDPPGE